ncbi:N-acetyltransferase [Schizosaccharomyces japonicus yFS275]|uniref:N-acetyltransferase n=1 Tax=Schizosaccharomyces japonicus (strain yFS275 / FY16936) TaxID=402676 RepID=B6K108_SCHJY|nr:N-acetyltransferase [Schizosaccharomyces japonicus yFS275]EEB07629.1 N-acetyltransferase [Schizosaccharomyces japonicus yFS275]
MIELDSVTKNNVKVLETINSVCLPTTQFSAQFYKDSPAIGDLAQFAYFNQICVGAVRCKKDSSHKQPKLQINSLCVLPAYHNQGVGSKLLEHALEQASNISAKEMYVYINKDDQEAIGWFMHKGFTSQPPKNGNEDVMFVSKQLK